MDKVTQKNIVIVAEAAAATANPERKTKVFVNAPLVLLVFIYHTKSSDFCLGFLHSACCFLALVFIALVHACVECT